MERRSYEAMEQQCVCFFLAYNKLEVYPWRIPDMSTNRNFLYPQMVLFVASTHVFISIM